MIKILFFNIYCKLYGKTTGLLLGALILLPARGHAYNDGMGYLELRLAPGLPVLMLRINGKGRGHLTRLFRRFYLPTGRYRIALEGSSGHDRFTLSTNLTVGEDSTTRRTLTPRLLRKKPPSPKKTHPLQPPTQKKPQGNKKNTPPQQIGDQREILFIRDPGRRGTRAFLFLEGTRLGEIRSGERLRVLRKPGRKYNLLIILFRGMLRAEQHRVITLEKAVGPKRVLLGF